MNIVYFTRNKTRNVCALDTLALPFIEIVIVVDGTMRYSYKNEEIELHAGDIIIFKKGEVRGRKSGGAAEYYGFNVLLNEDDVLPMFNVILRDQVTEEIKTLLSLYETYRTNFSEYAEDKRKHCFLLLYYILYEMSKISIESKYVTQIKQYIAEHIYESITVSQVSKSVFLSPNYCNTFFKSETGQNLNEYIRKEKMKRAQYMIINTDISLKEIAVLIGYKQYSYFTRVFIKEFHISPSQYRKSITFYTN